MTEQESRTVTHECATCGHTRPESRMEPSGYRLTGRGNVPAGPWRCVDRQACGARRDLRDAH